MRVKFYVMLNQFMLNSLLFFLSEIIELKEIIAVLLTWPKTFNVGMHLYVYELIWFKLGMMIDTTEY